jgi:hypothetical protein
MEIPAMSVVSRARIVVLCSSCLLPAGVASAESPSPSWSFEGNQPGARFGSSVSSAGDVNGDGYGDLIVGAPHRANGEVGEGAAFLFLGSAAGLSPEPARILEGDQAGAHFGFSVATAGDVNGDGYGDVLVGAPDFGAGGEGAAFLYLGSPAGLSPVPERTWPGSRAGGRFGSSVGRAGDVNADGFEDVVIGAPGDDAGEIDEGGAFLFLGAAELPTAAAWSAHGDQGGAAFGSSVAALGDLNGDGFDDVVIGAPLFDGGLVDEGQARVFGGSSTGLGAAPFQNFEANNAGTQFGFAVAGAANLSGNGVPRLLFGAPIYTYTHQEEGGTFLGALGQGVFFLDFGRQDFAHRGASIASAGDVNGDGLTDVVIGADRFDAGEEDEGRVTLHLGHSGFVVDRSPAWVLDGNQAFSAFGFAVASAGDVNGDGLDDVVVGAPRHDHGEDDEGRAFLYLGSSPTVGLDDVSGAARGLAIRPIAPNPFREGVRVAYTIPRRGRVHLSIHDVRGRERVLLVDDLRDPGSHAETWDGRDAQGVVCPAGLYVIRLSLDGTVTARSHAKVLRLDR